MTNPPEGARAGSDAFQRIKSCFLEAMALPRAERAAHVARVCGDDESMRLEVEALISERESSHGVDLYPEAEATPVHPADRAAAIEPPRESLGGYKIVDTLGRGGMGSVYVAEQQSPRRRVALKVIRGDLLGTQAFQRFRLEAEILGRLEHEGIARIYEAGTAPGAFGDEPYIAMELVDGVPLDDYARAPGRQRLEILAILERVARAAAHAHRRGIIHRDLKPANILVDRDGRPKILDFGISRLTGDACLTSPAATSDGQILGTLAYMSPEQAAGTNADVDTRSDVYSLGVIAYECLAGKIPCGLPRASLGATIQAIREAEPEPLDKVVTGLDRDVALIVQRALEKEKERRYPSADAFADDIRRYLDHEPITARPSSAVYQVTKFARRHRVLVAGAVAVILALGGGIAATARQAVLKERARQDEATAHGLADRRAHEADMARRDAESRLEESLALQRDVDLAITTARAGVKGRDVKLVDAMIVAEPFMHQEFAARPAVEAAVRLSIGVTYQSLGLYEDARRNLEESLRLREKLLGPDDPLTALSRYRLGDLHQETGRLEQADEELDDAVHALRRKLPDTLAVFGEAALALARVRKDTGDRVSAGKLYEEALDAMARTRGPRSQFMAVALGEYGAYLRDLRRYEESRVAYTNAIGILLEVDAPRDLDVAQIRHNLGLVLYSLKRFDEAETNFRAALDYATATLGELHPYTITFKTSLAGFLGTRKKLDEARRLAGEVLESSRKVDDGGGSLISALCLAAEIHRGANEPEAAEPLAREALARCVTVLGEANLETLMTRRGLALTLELRGRLDLAEVEMRSVVATAEKKLDAADPSLATLRFELGRLLVKAEKLEEALDQLTRVLEVFGRPGADPNDTRAILDDLAKLARRMGRDDDAARYEARLEALGAQHP